MPIILSSIACNLDADILAAAIPLLEEERVEAIEWSFDAVYNFKHIPPWFQELLSAFSNEKRLIGHGIFFSLFSGKWSQEQNNWLTHLRQTCADFQFDHITEHFGFMTGRDFHSGAPLAIPYTPATLMIGRDRLKRIYDVCRCPVGLENLAFSYSLDEVKRHGEFLEKLIEPINGFIILDLHNLYCQVNNFNIPFEEIVALYPLEKVREIHISGGSWEEAGTEPGRNIRRDTHDDEVPPEVFHFLGKIISKFPNLKFVVLEQLGAGLKTEKSRQLFYKDFLAMEKIIREQSRDGANEVINSFFPASFIPDEHIPENEMLYEQQVQLSSILETATSYDEAIQRLKNSALENTEWNIQNWKPYMLETAIRIAQKWKKQGLDVPLNHLQ